MKIITEKNLNKVREALKKEKLAVRAQGEDFNRKLLENKNLGALVLNLEAEKDYLKQRDSGLNEVLCKLAAKNNIKIAIDLDAAINKPEVEKAKSLSRLIQNINLCKRTKTKLLILTKKDQKAISSLMLSLGASTKQAKEAKESF